MGKKISLFIIVSVLTFIISGNMRAVYAENAPESTGDNRSALGVSPAIVENILTPGETTEIKVNVFNVLNFPLPIKADVKAFLAREQIEGNKDVFDVSSWITPDPSDFILQPNENKEITLTIAVPQGAEPGGHYATVFFQPLIPSELISPSNTFLTARVGILTLFIVKGNLQEQGQAMKPIVKSFNQWGPINIEAPFHNTGNVHVMPTGKAKIKDMFGKEVADLDITPSIVLPQTQKNLSLVWDKKLLFGKYTVFSEMTYGPDNTTTQSDVASFWVIPLSLVIGIIILLTLAYIFLIILRVRLISAFKVLTGKVDISHDNKTSPKGGDKD